MQITLEVPEKFGFDKSQNEVGRTLKLYAALGLFQSGKLSASAATELAGIDRYAFMAKCKQNDIPTINYSADDLKADLANYADTVGDSLNRFFGSGSKEEAEEFNETIASLRVMDKK